MSTSDVIKGIQRTNHHVIVAGWAFSKADAKRLVDAIQHEIDEMEKSPWDRAEYGTLVTLGHIKNGRIARKERDGRWYTVYDHLLIDEEDKYGGFVELVKKTD